MSKITQSLSAQAPNASLPTPAYKNAARPAIRRVKDLLARMTTEEKIAQMQCVWQEKAKKLVDAEGNFDPAKAKVAFKRRLGLGQVGRPSDAGAPGDKPWLGRTARQTSCSCP